QQVRVLHQLVRDLDVPVRLCVCPTVREPDGLALSSRTQYLDPDQRRHATALYQALCEVERQARNGERQAAALRHTLTTRIAEASGARLDDAVVGDARTLQPVEQLRGEVLVALAVFFGSTRLIDNILLNFPEVP